MFAATRRSPESSGGKRAVQSTQQNISYLYFFFVFKLQQRSRALLLHCLAPSFKVRGRIRYHSAAACSGHGPLLLPQTGPCCSDTDKPSLHINTSYAQNVLLSDSPHYLFAAAIITVGVLYGS